MGRREVGKRLQNSMIDSMAQNLTDEALSIQVPSDLSLAGRWAGKNESSSNSKLGRDMFSTRYRIIKAALLISSFATDRKKRLLAEKWGRGETPSSLAVGFICILLFLSLLVVVSYVVGGKKSPLHSPPCASALPSRAQWSLSLVGSNFLGGEGDS